MADAPKQADPNNPQEIRAFLKKRTDKARNVRIMRDARTRFQDQYEEELPDDLRTASAPQLALLANIVDELGGGAPKEGDPAAPTPDGLPADPDATRVRHPRPPAPADASPKTVEQRLTEVEGDLGDIKYELTETRAVLAMTAREVVANGGRLRNRRVDASKLRGLPSELDSVQIFKAIEGGSWK